MQVALHMELASVGLVAERPQVKKRGGTLKTSESAPALLSVFFPLFGQSVDILCPALHEYLESVG